MKTLLENLSAKVGSQLETRRYNLSTMISESYKTLYDCEKDTNLYRLVESHLADVRKNPKDIDRLSRQLSIIKEITRMIENKDINDEDLETATTSKVNGEVEESTEPDKYCIQSHQGDYLSTGAKSWVAKDSKNIKTFSSKEEADAYAEKYDIKYSTVIKFTESKDILEEDAELTDEEIEELTKHLEDIRKSKKVGESKEPIEEEVEESVSEYDQKLWDEITTILGDAGLFSENARGYTENEEEAIDKLIDLVKSEREESKKTSMKESTRGYKLKMREASKKVDETLENGRTDSRESEVLDMIFSWMRTKYDDEEFASICRRRFDMTPEEISTFCDIQESISASKSYSHKSLKEFADKSKGKAFLKTFKQLSDKLHEGTALTRQESINLYKAANSAMTHLSVELEKNPDFLFTFNESVSILSNDVNRILESMKNGKAPSKDTMKSLAKFSEALLREEEDEEDEFVVDDESAVEEDDIDAFDQEYADARVELHKELADAHADEETPEVQEKLAQDAEEVAALPGTTEEQAAEVLGEETPDPEEDSEEDSEEVVENKDEPVQTEDSSKVEDAQEEPDSKDLDLGGDEITDDELAELKKHLKEMRAATK